jgi:hydroxymethylbilane synthase
VTAARAPQASRAARDTGGRVVRIGTRASALALKQAQMVQAALAARGVGAELVTFTTTGDKRLDEPLSAIGAKGLFTTEIENALRRKKIDCAVHSLKDLATGPSPGLAIVAVLPREDPRDVLVLSSTARAVGLGDLPRGSRVGTSSLRRRAQLLALRPDLEVVELRGNVPTRLRKVDDGQVHAAILAAAGLHRLDATQHIAAYLEPPEWLPAPGQGAIAVQARDDNPAVADTLAALNHHPTMHAVRAERAFLAALEGGCQVPIGALVVDAPGAAGARGTLHGLIADLGGRRVIRGARAVTSDPDATGQALADELRGRGADDILTTLRAVTRVVVPQPD